MATQLRKFITAHWLFLILLVVLASSFFLRLNRDLLMDWDECIYALQAHEMKVSHNYLTSTWNGTTFFEKPPLNNWLLQLPLLFGESEFLLRSLSVLFGLALLTAVYFAGVRLYSKRVGIIALLLLLTSSLYAGYMTKLDTDIIYSFFVFTGVLAWLASFKKPQFAWLSGVLLGLAVMEKGLSVTPYIAALFVTTFIEVKKEYFVNFAKLILAFLVVVLPWHAYEYSLYGKQFIQVYFFEHILKRATQPVEFHYEGRLFYAKLLLQNLFPWIFAIVALLLALGIRLRGHWSIKDTRKIIHTYQTTVIFALVFLVVFLAITNARTRIAWYAIPLFPFLSLLLAYSLDLIFNKIKWSLVAYIVIAIIAVQASVVVWNQTHPLDSVRSIDTRHDVFIKAQQISQPSIEYLVWKPERTAEAILPPEQRLSTTFLYGGNACAAYYSQKHIHYYYSIPEFKTALTKPGQAFVIEKGDLELIKNVPIMTLYKNSDFTLFTVSSGQTEK